MKSRTNVLPNATVTKRKQNTCPTSTQLFLFSANSTLLLVDGKINKQIVKRIYNANAFHEPKWMKLVSESVEICKFEESKSLSKSLAKFYECINQNLEDNCVSFVNTIECDKVEEHFESCRNETFDCKTWPEMFVEPEPCCNTPQLFPHSSRHNLNCRKKCSTEEFFLPRQITCVEDCMNSESKLKAHGKFDFKIAKILLLENTNKKEEWDKPITEV
jgi:hypothetical protein